MALLYYLFLLVVGGLVYLYWSIRRLSGQLRELELEVRSDGERRDSAVLSNAQRATAPAQRDSAAPHQQGSPLFPPGFSTDDEAWFAPVPPPVAGPVVSRPLAAQSAASAQPQILTEAQLHAQPTRQQAEPVAATPESFPSQPRRDAVPPPPPQQRRVAAELGVPAAKEQAVPMPRGVVPPPPEPARRPARSYADWEALIGGQLLNRIGALALVIGMGFFLKYAFDNNWITERMQVLIGLLIGAGLFVIADRSRRQDQLTIFAQGLVGAGVAILYLSVYAAFNLYHLVPQSSAAVMMILVTTIAFIQAISYDALAIALLSWAGGFLTPGMLSTGSANQLGLFSYLFLLDVGICAIVVRKRAWFILEPLTVVATYAIYFFWQQVYYQPDAMVVTLAIVLLFWGLFYLLHMAHLRDVGTTYPRLRRLVAGFNVCALYVALATILAPLPALPGALLTLLIAGIYLLTCYGLWNNGIGSQGVHAQYAITGLILVALATRMGCSGFALIAVWTLEALLCVWLGTRWKLWYLWQPGLELLGVAYLGLFLVPGALGGAAGGGLLALANPRALAVALLVLGLGISARWLRRVDHPLSASLIALLQYSWCALLLVGLTVETMGVFRALAQRHPAALEGLGLVEQLALSTIWCVYAVLLMAWSRRLHNSTFRVCGLGILALAVAWGGLSSLSVAPGLGFMPLLNPRAATLLLLQLFLLREVRELERQLPATRWAGPLRTLLFVALSLLSFELFTAETLDYFKRLLLTRPGGATGGLAFTRGMVLALVWAGYGLPMVRYGLRARCTPFLTMGLGAFGLATATLVVQGWSYHPIVSFMPLLNLRALTFGILIGGVALLWRWLHASRHNYAWITQVRVPAQALGLLLAFELVTVETLDCFAWLWPHFPAPLSVPAVIARDLVLALVWLGYALPLIRYGLRRAQATFMAIGSAALSCALLLIVVEGWRFTPGTTFLPVLNLRALTFAALIGALALSWRWLEDHGQRFAHHERAVVFVQVLAMLSVFELLSAEVVDLFLAELRARPFADRLQIRQMEHLTLSLVWLAYSIVLLLLGLWRGRVAARLMAIALFGMTICKIFGYDLAFLPTPYRIISFGGLGVILLAVSYLYQRYRTLVVARPRYSNV